VRSALVHYGELALKGRNRPWFLNTLLRNIASALRGLDAGKPRHLMGRIAIPLGPEADWAEVRDRLARLPGIGNFTLATHVPADLEAIASGVLDAVRGRSTGSFRISARRADKRFPFSTPDIERDIGGRVQAITGWKVDLSRPELVIHIEIVTSDAFFYFDRFAGAGGLPVGTSGRVLCLLSGGIDSPVAAWRILRRGCQAQFVHFHSYPILSNTSQEKARTLVERLTRHQLRSRLHLVPFGAVQQQVVVTVPPPLRVVIYRRLMVRIAEAIARPSGAQALVTGDVIGQVASQTIENLSVVERVATMPVLRPLIGFDKEEITAEAQRLGTYETSIIPDEDCCTLFTPRFPSTRATLEAAEAAEAALDVDTLVARAVAGTVAEHFRYPAVHAPVNKPGLFLTSQKQARAQENQDDTHSR
jgi:thiamine biosynthesis protein ThiI